MCLPPSWVDMGGVTSSSDRTETIIDTFKQVSLAYVSNHIMFLFNGKL